MKTTPKPLKKFPRLRTDEEAEALLAQDLSEYDFSEFKPIRFEFVKPPLLVRSSPRKRGDIAISGSSHTLVPPRLASPRRRPSTAKISGSLTRSSWHLDSHVGNILRRRAEFNPKRPRIVAASAEGFLKQPYRKLRAILTVAE
jgi:hypothetical protein